MTKYLDKNGLQYFWEKIKALISNYTVRKLSQPTDGYRDSYILEKDGDTIDGSATIDIPTEFTPLVSKEYTGTDFYAPSGTWDNSSRYFMSVRPDALKEFWYVKYRVRVWIPSDTTEKRFTDSIIEYFGSGILMKGYRIWNTINTSSAAYYQVAYWLTADGYNNQNPTDPFGHVLGTSILYGTNYTTSSWYRHVKVDLLAYEGCEVNMFDNLVKWSEYKTSTGATNVATGVEHPDYNTTDPSTYNATSQGLQETGDATDTTNMYLVYARFTAGTYGMMNRSLVMQDGNGKWQSFTTTSGTGASKTKNPSGFRLGSRIYYMGSTTDIAADAVLGTTLIRAFVNLIDFRYDLNITTTAGGANNLLPYKPLYIVGTIHNDGLFYLDDIWWAQDEPNTENGKIYIKVCPAIYNDYTNDRCYRGDLNYNGDAYWYKNGRFQRYYDVDWKTDKVANAVNGNLAGLDATGNLTDSGYSPSDFITSGTLPQYTLAQLSTPTTGYEASYVLKKDGTQVGDTVNIPKDYRLKSGTVEVVTTADTPYTGAVVGDKYLDLVVNTLDNSGTATHIYVPLIGVGAAYSEGNGIDISNNNVISVQIDSNNAHGLSVGANGLAFDDSNLVHKTGDEQINGDKTFFGDVILSYQSTLQIESSQGEGVSIYADENSNDSVRELHFEDENGSYVRLKGVGYPVDDSDAVPKEYLEESILDIDKYKIYSNIKTGAYGLMKQSLCAFYVTNGGTSASISSFTTSSGTGAKDPITNAVFPIGCKIYYYDRTSDISNGLSVSSQRLYTSYNGIDARYSAVTGTSLSLGDYPTNIQSSVFLRVSVSGGYWSPYYKSGETNEIIVSSNQLVANNFYIYLGKAVGASASAYTIQLEDNNPLYYYDGSSLIDWASYVSDSAFSGCVQSITVGTTTTGEPNTNASVVNSGTAINQILDFTIPRGADGEDAVNPFKGWFSSYSELDTAYPNPEDYAFAYVQSADPSDPVYVYVASGGSWRGTQYSFNPANNQEFASGESLNQVSIIHNLTTGGSGNVLDAQQGVVLNALINALQTAVEARPTYTRLNSEAQMQSMIDNHTWVEGVIYYTVED